MKKFLNAIILLAVMPICLLASSFENLEVNPIRNIDQDFRVPYMIKADVPSAMKTTFDMPQSVVYRPFLNSQGNPLRANWMLLHETEPIAYEPKSNTFVVAGRSIYETEEGQPFWENTGSVYLMWSNNNGQSWTQPTEVFAKAREFPLMPTISVGNPNNKTNPLEFDYFIHSRVARAADGATSAPLSGAQLLFITPDYTDGVYELGPQMNNPGSRQKWLSTFNTYYEKGGELYSVNVGRLTPDDGFQAGQYGMVSAQVSSVDYRSQMVPEWHISKFRQSEQLTSYYTNDIYVDSDPLGNVYVAVNNIFVDDINSRRVGFSKSTNNGFTWSEFNIMPKAVLEAYSISQGYPFDGIVPIAYQQDAFVVYGNDQFSYFLRMRLMTSEYFTIQLVEVKYNAGTWSIHKVADMNEVEFPVKVMPEMNDDRLPDGMFLMRLLPPFANAPETAYEPYLVNNNFEIQASKTLDGNILVKWLDYNGQYSTIQPTTVYFRANSSTDPYQSFTLQIDRVPQNDVFVAHRSISSPAWSNKLNLTNDARFNRNTFIPKLLKDLTVVPILHLRADLDNYRRTDTQTGLPVFPKLTSLPNAVLELTDNANHAYFVEVSTVDVKNFNSVNEVVAGTNTMQIFPNPVANFANINFSIDAPSNVVIRVSNAMGQTVAEIANAQYNEGLHNLSFDASQLANGTYYVTLTANGQSITKVLNIIK